MILLKYGAQITKYSTRVTDASVRVEFDLGEIPGDNVSLLQDMKLSKDSSIVICNTESFIHILKGLQMQGFEVTIPDEAISHQRISEARDEDIADSRDNTSLELDDTGRLPNGEFPQLELELEPIPDAETH